MSNDPELPDIRVVPTNLKHIGELSNTMRQEDKDEIFHLARLTPGEALAQSYNCSSYIRTALLDGSVVCIFGISKVGERGIPWMLASPLLMKVRKTFLRECRKYLEEMSQGVTSLDNVAWSKNTVHIQWLKWLGFTMCEGIPLGPDGEVYIPFYKVI